MLKNHLQYMGCYMLSVLTTIYLTWISAPMHRKSEQQWCFIDPLYVSSKSSTSQTSEEYVSFYLC
jgi:hypothetical protein